jgi:porphobilinogen synthase
MIERPRRLRSSAALRDLVAETDVRPRHLIWPVFVVAGADRIEPIASLPRVARRSIDALLPEVERALSVGVRSVMLFGVVDAHEKDATGSAVAAPDGVVPTAIRSLRAAFGDDLVIMSDVCLCGATDHGHCGLLTAPAAGRSAARIANDATLAQLSGMAVAHAEAGVDVVAPSDMMDGRVAAIRAGLDAQGHEGVAILSYAVKYASAFYGPFRDAAGSSPRGVGSAPRDRRTYQMDARNAREALRERRLDEAEGADLLLVKPALAYLDVIHRVRASSDRPVVAYAVSGEYAMLEAAAAAGALERGAAVAETLGAIRRAGADAILTYHAVEAAREGWLG